MPRFLKTIRQRPHRARKAQVSAIATILGLLLVVSMIANFVLLQLPGEMAQVEFDHTLLAENQLSRLQATILDEAEHPALSLALTTPVTLGSNSVPPFGPPTSGSISALPTGVQGAGHFSLSQIVSSPPAWNKGSDPCASGSGSPCASNGNLVYWNYSLANNTTLNIKVAGGNNGLIYNFNGNNDTINIDWTGKDTTIVNFVVNGSDNVINYHKSGSDVGSPTAKFFFFGQNDVFNFNPSGGGTSKGGLTLSVQFVGTFADLCPYGNLSASDTIGTLVSGGKNINMSVVWWNALGYVSPPHTTPYPSGTNATITWTNQTGFVECAFTTAYTTAYTEAYQGGLVVHEYNRYSPGADVAFDEGAIILGETGGQAVMITPPPVGVTALPSGLAVSITRFNIVMNTSSGESGVTTAGLSTHVLAVHHLAVISGRGGFFLTSPYFLNLTTLYPSAWATYMAGFPSIFPYGAVCTPITPIFPPYSCLQPPSGVAVHISGPVYAQSIQVTEITVSVTLS